MTHKKSRNYRLFSLKRSPSFSVNFSNNTHQFHRSGFNRAVDIEHSDDAPVNFKRNYDFGLGRCITRNVSGECVHIFNALDPAVCISGAADAFPERDSYACRKSLERPEHKLTVFGKIKARPVDVFQ